MPVTRVSPAEPDVLQNAVEALEADGQDIVHCYPYAGEWFIIHRPAPKPMPRGSKVIERRVDP